MPPKRSAPSQFESATAADQCAMSPETTTELEQLEGAGKDNETSPPAEREVVKRVKRTPQTDDAVKDTTDQSFTVTPGLQSSEDTWKNQVEALQAPSEERTKPHEEQLANEREEIETRFERECKARVTQEEQLNERITAVSKECQRVQYAFDDEVNAHNSTKSARNNTIIMLSDTLTRNEQMIETLQSEKAALENDRTGLREQLIDVQSESDQKARQVEKLHNFCIDEKVERN